MGGKSSKQKVKITNAEGGKRAQGKTKEQKARAKNGETATEKRAENKVTENEDIEVKQTTVKAENAVTDLIEKRTEDESPSNNKKESTIQPESVAESRNPPSQSTPPPEAQPVVKQDSPQPNGNKTEATPTTESQPVATQESPQLDGNKTEASVEESVQEMKPKDVAKEEVQEKLEVGASQEDPCLQVSTEKDKVCEAYPVSVPTEKEHNNCQLTNGVEGGNIPEASSETQVATKASDDMKAVEIEDTNNLIESTKCDDEGLEQHALQQRS